jgi:hypothetical protein
LYGIGPVKGHREFPRPPLNRQPVGRAQTVYLSRGGGDGYRPRGDDGAWHRVPQWRTLCCVAGARPATICPPRSTASRLPQHARCWVSAPAAAPGSLSGAAAHRPTARRPEPRGGAAEAAARGAWRRRCARGPARPEKVGAARTGPRGSAGRLRGGASACRAGGPTAADGGDDERDGVQVRATRAAPAHDPSQGRPLSA